MIQTKGQGDDELARVIHDAADDLSPDHVATLVAHPEAVRSALTDYDITLAEPLE